MSDRPFWNARDVGLLLGVLCALGALPAATRLAPMGWQGALDSPQWWSNTRMMGDPTCMTPLYGPDATVRELVFEPACSFGWGARGRDDYNIEQVRYRFEQVAVMELSAKAPIVLEPEALEHFGLPVAPPDRSTTRIDAGGRLVRTLSWWDVQADGHMLDRVDLSERTLASGRKRIRVRLYVNRYPYDTTHVREEVDHPTLGLALPEGNTRRIQDRPHAWLSSREVGVRTGQDTTGDESRWTRMPLEAPELSEALAEHLERHETAQHDNRQLLLYASRSVRMGRVIALLSRAKGLGFRSVALMALREERGGSGREGEWLGRAEPISGLKFHASAPLYTLRIDLKGFTIRRISPDGAQKLRALPGCSPDGPTVCLTPGTWDPSLGFDQAARHDDAGRLDEGARALDAGLERFDYLRLYVLGEALAHEIGRGDSFVHLDVADDVPVALLVRTLTVFNYARGPSAPVETGDPTPCVPRPRDEEEMWSFVPCDENTRDIAVQLSVP